METVDLRGAESAMKRAERTKNAGKDTEKIYFNRLGTIKQQKRVNCKKMGNIQQMGKSSVKQSHKNYNDL